MSINLKKRVFKVIKILIFMETYPDEKTIGESEYDELF